MLPEGQYDPGQYTYRPVRRKNGVSIPRLIAVMAIAAILMAVAMSAMNFNRSSGYGDTTEEYAWHIPDSPISGIKFEISVTLIGDEIEAARSSGIDRSGSSTNSPTSGEYAVKDYVVVSETITNLANALWEEYKTKIIDSPMVSGYSSPKLFSDYVLAFVDYAADYQTDEEQFEEAEYWLYPIETLYFGKGDCEDTSILACSLYSALSGIDGAKDMVSGACVYLLPGHAMVGIDVVGGIPPSASTFSTDVGGKEYYFGETTIDNPDSWMSVGELGKAYYGASTHGYVGIAKDYVK